MKNHILITALFLLIALNPLRAQDAEILRAQQTVTGFFDALAQMENNTLKSYVTNDFLLLEDAQLFRTADLLTEMEKVRMFDIQRINTIKFFDGKRNGKTIWLTYQNTADFLMDNKKMQLNWLESAILVKQGRQWKIQLMHVTTMPDGEEGSKK